MTLNVQLLEKVKSAILREPERFDMQAFAYEGGCGTIMCIAGWACAIANKTDPLPGSSIREKAIEILGDSNVVKLFYGRIWPDALRKRYKYAYSDESRAQVACSAIDSFIADPQAFGDF